METTKRHNGTNYNIRLTQIAGGGCVLTIRCRRPKPKPKSAWAQVAEFVRGFIPTGEWFDMIAIT